MNLRNLLNVLLSIVTSQTVFGFQGFQRNVLNLPDITSETNSLRGVAWTHYDVIKSPLNAISTCMWVKSTDLSQTGTLFSYSTQDNEIQFALASYKEAPGQGSNPQTEEERRSNERKLLSYNATGNFEVYLVVGGDYASEPVELRLDDVIWHYVCVTWNSSGSWKIFIDGGIAGKGDNLKVGGSIPAGGRFYFGSGPKFHNGSRNSTDDNDNILPFTGKITGLSLWNATLRDDDVTSVSSCEYYNKKQRFGWNFDNQNDSLSTFDRLRRALVYDWSVDSVTVTWPAGFYPNENVCGSEVTVDCSHNQMIISLSSIRTSSLQINQSHLHLNDPTCVPVARGRHGNRYVFDVTDFNSCGTKRTVTDTEVVYTNTVSNLPTSKQVLFVIYLYRSVVRCHYPIDLTVSTRLIDDQQHNQLISRTPMFHPRTHRENLEALVLLFQDEAFALPFNATPHLSPLDHLYVGLVVKDKMTQSPIDDVIVVVDTCWLTSQKHRRRIIANKGCWTSSDDVTVLENGRRSQARIKLASKLLSFSTGPVYLKCSLYPCVGRSCEPSCDTDETAASLTHAQAEALITSSDEMRLSKRAVDQPNGDSSNNRLYDVTIGPVYARGFWTHKLVNVEDNDSANISRTEVDSFQLSPVFLVTIIILSVVAVASLLLTIALLRKKRRDAARESNDVTIPVQITRHKRRQSSDVSLTSISSAVMTSSIGSLSSLESFDYSTSLH